MCPEDIFVLVAIALRSLMNFFHWNVGGGDLPWDLHLPGNLYQMRLWLLKFSFLIGLDCLQLCVAPNLYPFLCDHLNMYWSGWSGELTITGLIFENFTHLFTVHEEVSDAANQTLSSQRFVVAAEIVPNGENFSLCIIHIWFGLTKIGNCFHLFMCALFKIKNCLKTPDKYLLLFLASCLQWLWTDTFLGTSPW